MFGDGRWQNTARHSLDDSDNFWNFYNFLAIFKFDFSFEIDNFLKHSAFPLITKMKL